MAVEDRRQAAVAGSARGRFGQGAWRRWRALWALALALLGAAWPAAQAATEAAPPALSFVRTPQLQRAVISPAGDRVALLVTAPSGRSVLAVRSLQNASAPKVVGVFSDADVYSVAWVNNERLVYEARRPGPLIYKDGAGTFAVDHDGGNELQLIAWRTDNQTVGSRIARRGLTYGWFLYRTFDDDSADIVVAWRDEDAMGAAQIGRLARLNTRTGALTSLSEGAPPFVNRWVFDGQGQLRAVATLRDGRSRLHWRAPGSETWTQVMEQAPLGAEALTPVFLEPDGSLIVEGRRGRDASALYTMKLPSGELDPEPLLALDGFDVNARIKSDSRSGRVVGVHTRGARPLSVWFDERLAGVQAAVDQSLPAGRVNRLDCGRCESTRHFIVFSHSDSHSGEYLHFDSEARKLTRLGPSRPWLPEATQGKRSFHRVNARDGLPLPVVVTHPPGSAVDQPLPTVMLVHGGPWVRGSDTTWSAGAQFLATRGWRVLEVEFRGSDGFGWRHFQAGWKQWGEAMQDDLADALAWAVREKLVDASRVCIYGASYGGYAALMAPIRYPGLFRCAASHVGVTDIDLLYNATWGDITTQSKRYSMPVLIGDPKLDAELLRAASPLRRVAELKLPLLLAYSGRDQRVPKEHADKFLSAARRAGVAVEELYYAEEGHGWFDQANHADFLQKLERFLAKALAR